MGRYQIGMMLIITSCLYTGICTLSSHLSSFYREDYGSEMSNTVFKATELIRGRTKPRSQLSSHGPFLYNMQAALDAKTQLPALQVILPSQSSAAIKKCSCQLLVT